MNLEKFQPQHHGRHQEAIENKDYEGVPLQEP
jgi:hypothetical protein